MDFIWMLKVVVIVAVLRHFRIFGVQSTAMYIIGIIVLAFLKPIDYGFIPARILMSTVIMFSVYVFSTSAYDLLRNIRKINIKSFLNKGVIDRYTNFFFGMFLFSGILYFFDLSFVIAIFFMVVFFVAVEYVKLNVKWITAEMLDYKLYSVGILLYFVFMNDFMGLSIVIKQSLFSCGLLFVFLFVQCFNTYPCPLNELRRGMVPAETIVKENKRYVKIKVPYISVPIYVRRKVVNEVFRRGEFVTPFAPLTDEKIKILRNDTQFDILMIQKVIDLRIFLLLGIIGAYFIA